MERTAHAARPFWAWLHRWVGLAMALPLIVAGLTGSLLAFDHELERVFAPHLFAAPRALEARLDLATLAERAAAQVPHGRVLAVTRIEPDQVQVYFAPRIDPATSRPYALGFDEYYVDPWTGAELGHRTRADLSEGLVNLMPFVYELHWRLVAGSVGQWILGITALCWTLDCFYAFYLTWPRTRARFWARWSHAWTVRLRTSVPRVNFDLHRAGGLWLWPLLFVFAWSSVMMNIRPWYEPVMHVLFDYSSFEDRYRVGARANDHPVLDWRGAQDAAERHLDVAGAARKVRATERLALQYDPGIGAYLYDVRGQKDLFERAPQGGSTTLLVDGDTGALRWLDEPTGEHVGNTIESWLYALHMARIFGRPYQVLVCLLGMVTALLSGTGIYLWARKRRPRAGRMA